MILGFMKKMPGINGEATEFEEKIKDGRKIHTIRRDENRRWKVGMSIQFATGQRTKDYQQFYEGKCIAIQKIKIDTKCETFVGYDYDEVTKSKTKPVKKLEYAVFVDGRRLSDLELIELIVNDGLSIEQFKRYFNEDFEGIIVHWTNKLY